MLYTASGTLSTSELREPPLPLPEVCDEIRETHSVQISSCIEWIPVRELHGSLQAYTLCVCGRGGAVYVHVAALILPGIRTYHKIHHTHVHVQY